MTEASKNGQHYAVINLYRLAFTYSYATHTHAHSVYDLSHCEPVLNFSPASLPLPPTWCTFRKSERHKLYITSCFKFQQQVEYDFWPCILCKPLFPLLLLSCTLQSNDGCLCVFSFSSWSQSVMVGLNPVSGNRNSYTGKGRNKLSLMHVFLRCIVKYDCSFGEAERFF